MSAPSDASHPLLQLEEVRALFERRVTEHQDKGAGEIDEFRRGYRAGYANAMRFALSELKRIEQAMS